MTVVAERNSGGRPAVASRRRRHARWFTSADKLMLGLMIGVPSLVVAIFVVLPAIESIVLSFTDWTGIGLDSIQFIGLHNYVEIFTNYPAFWPAVLHNLIWLVFFVLIPTPFGILLAYL